MKSITIYRVAGSGMYSNMDQAEIVNVLSVSSSEVSKIELTTTETIESDALSCHVNDETGLFTIQNEDTNVICDLEVLVDINKDGEYFKNWDTLDVTSHEINDYDYTITINKINVKDINLTDDLQRYISSEVENWIARTNRNNGF